MSTICSLRYACSPRDAKSYDTARLREEFLIEDLFTVGDIRLTYSLFDRFVVGGVMPSAGEPLTLQPVEEMKAEYFNERRELGIINVGGSGWVQVDDTRFDLEYKEALYVGKGAKEILFGRAGEEIPKFYLNSAPAHTSYPTRKVTKEDAIVVELGSLGESNHRIINKLIVKELFPTCQLQMGMTELQLGSVWNTMPPHTHNRRMEAYFYFDMQPTTAVCHFMGQIDETRHVWMKKDQAVLSPSWSIHSACSTGRYTFIWGMSGENLDYSDMDTCAATDLR